MTSPRPTSVIMVNIQFKTERNIYLLIYLEVPLTKTLYINICILDDVLSHLLL